MNPRDERLTVHGAAVRLLRAGAGRPILYLHDTFAMTESGPVWTPLHDALATKYDVLFPVHPGCIGSEDDEDIHTLEDLLFHYLDVCETLQIEQPLLLGASLGGWLAAEWAVRYSPMLRGIVLLDALGLRVPDAPTADILRLDPAQTRAVLFADPSADAAQRYIPDVPTPEMLPALLRAKQTLARFAWQFPDNPQLTRYVRRVRVPTLIVWGKQDGFVSPAHAKVYHCGINGAELQLLPQCGHLPHVEQPEACAEAITAYLTQHGL